MSSINEALKKAQKDKDVHQIRYRGVLTAKSKGNVYLRGRTVRTVLILLSITLLAFLGYSWLDLRGKTPVGPKEVKNPPPPINTGEKADAKNLYNHARSLHRQGRLQDAKRLYQEILKDDPGFIDILNNLGVLYIHEGDYPAARRTLEKAARLEPGDAVPYYNLACLYTIKGDMEQGLDYLKKAVSLNPSVSGWAQKDTDLENLRSLPEFHRIIEDDDPRQKE